MGGGIWFNSDNILSVGQLKKKGVITTPFFHITNYNNSLKPFMMKTTNAFRVCRFG
jgi:negative regulator of replication initiation